MVSELLTLQAKGLILYCGHISSLFFFCTFFRLSNGYLVICHWPSDAQATSAYSAFIAIISLSVAYLLKYFTLSGKAELLTDGQVVFPRAPLMNDQLDISEIFLKKKKKKKSSFTNITLPLLRIFEEHSSVSPILLLQWILASIIKRLWCSLNVVHSSK